MKSKHAKADVNPERRTAFNKENAPELLGQLVRVLKSQGMDDALQAIKSCGITKKLNDEWMGDTRNRQKRKHRASARIIPMSSDRKALIRLASKMPVGDPSRKVILAELQKQAARPMDRGRLQEMFENDGYLSVHTGPKAEDKLRAYGLEIPPAGKSGPVRFKGKKVGFMDNWAGLKLKDEAFILKHKRFLEGFAWMYTNG